MKVRIRRYPRHYSIYNYWPFNKFYNWFCARRRIFVKYDPWDTWNLDYTLAHIILPGLKQLKETNHGMPWVDNEDVPENLRIEKGDTRKEYYEDYEYNESNDDILLARWNYVQDEMINAFEKISDDDWENQYYDWSDVDKSKDVRPWSKIKVDYDGLEKEQKRIQNGLRLFGKYYQALWD